MSFKKYNSIENSYQQKYIMKALEQYPELKDMDQFGKYIQLMLSDAKEDFLKDYDISKFDDKELKKIFRSGGKHVAILLKGYV